MRFKLITSSNSEYKKIKKIINNYIKYINCNDFSNKNDMINIFEKCLIVSKYELLYPNIFHYFGEKYDFVFPEERNNYFYIDGFFIKKDYKSLSIVKYINEIFIHDTLKLITSKNILFAYTKITSVHCTEINIMYNYIINNIL